MRLFHEDRWIREYRDPLTGSRYYESKFIDGTTSITIKELEDNWPSWTQAERISFCESLSWIPKPLLFEVLRYLGKKGDYEAKYRCANLFARLLPADESVPILLKLLSETKLGHAANVYQALGNTHNMVVLPSLVVRHNRMWDMSNTNSNENLTKNDRLAEEAVACLEAIMKVGGMRKAYEANFRILMDHKSKRVREAAAHCLRPYFYNGSDPEENLPRSDGRALPRSFF